MRGSLLSNFITKPSKPYAAFKTQLQAVDFSQPAIVVAFGSSDYFLLLASRILKERFLATYSGGGFEELQPQDFGGASDLVQRLLERCLFEPQTFHVVTGIEKKKDFNRSLSSIGSADQLSGPMLLVFSGESPQKDLIQELQRLNAGVIPCFDPAPFEYLDFIEDRWQGYASNHLERAAKELLIEQNGYDTRKLDNEMQKLAAIFYEGAGTIRASEIAAHLGLLREEHLFKLDQLLCSAQFPAAQLLVRDLLIRGESALALLGFLARHLRQALMVASGASSGLPAFIAKNLRRYQGSSQQKLLACLRRCHEIDMDLKGAGVGISEELALAGLVAEIEGVTA